MMRFLRAFVNFFRLGRGNDHPDLPGQPSRYPAEGGDRVELVPGPHRRAAPWCTRAFGCRCGDLLARSRPLWRNGRRVPSEDEAASDAAFTYLIGLSGRGMVFRLGWLFLRIRSRTTLPIRGRPPRRRDFHRKYAAKPIRCQRTTVSGLTMVTARSG